MTNSREKRCGTKIDDRADDKFVYSLDRLEIIGCGQVRATFLVKIGTDEGGFELKPASFAVVIPATSLPDAIGKAMVAIGKNIYAFADGSLTVAL